MGILEVRYSLISNTRQQVPEWGFSRKSIGGHYSNADCQDCGDKYPANETDHDILADISTITSTIAGNYNISVDQNNVGKFVVLPADLTVTTDSPELPAVYGDVKPDFTATIEGYVYEETEADVFPDGLEIAVACTDCEVGTYEITASTSNSSANYNITYENLGEYVVGKAPVL